MTPTSDDRDLVAELRASLEQRAQDAPHVDLGRPALRQAQRIRTRRRLGVGVVAATVALAVPSAVTLLRDDVPRDHTADRGTTAVDVAIDGLDQGAAPAVPYIDGSVFTSASGDSTPLPDRAVGSAAQVVDAVQLRDGVAFWERNADGDLVVRPSDGSSDLPAGPATRPVVDDDSGEVAYSIRNPKDVREGDRLVVTDSLRGGARSALAGLEVPAVMGVDGDQVVFNAVTKGGRFMAATSSTAFDGGLAGAVGYGYDPEYATAVTHDLDRYVGHTPDMKGKDAACTALFEDTEPDEVWRSCDWRGVEFSTDGSMVLALPTVLDGLGPTELTVLDADSGRAVTTLTTAGTFGRATFEGNDAVLSVVLVDEQAAIVRCPIDGADDCELATAPAQVAPGDPDSLVAPYQLTAN
jgi:hypothetical protein